MYYMYLHMYVYIPTYAKGISVHYLHGGTSEASTGITAILESLRSVTMTETVFFFNFQTNVPLCLISTGRQWYNDRQSQELPLYQYLLIMHCTTES